MQLQREQPHSFTELCQKLHGVGVILKSNNGVVCVTHDNDVATCAARTPLLNPEIEYVVQVDVRKERRALNRFDLRSVIHDSRGEPLAQQPKESTIRNPALRRKSGC